LNRRQLQDNLHEALQVLVTSTRYYRRTGQEWGQGMSPVLL